MTPEQAAAYVHAQAVAATAEIEGMKAENQNRMSNGWGATYTEDDFARIISKYGLHHNAVVTTFQNCD